MSYSDYYIVIDSRVYRVRMRHVARTLLAKWKLQRVFARHPEMRVNQRWEV